MRKDFIQSALKLSNVMEHHNEICEIAKTAPAELIPVFYEADQWKSSPTPWQIESIRESVIDTLPLTPGEESIRCLFEILPCVTNENEIRQIANMLAFSHDIQILTNNIVSFAEKLSPEFILVVAHELITRGNNLERCHEFHQLVQRLNQDLQFRGLTLYPIHWKRRKIYRNAIMVRVPFPLPFMVVVSNWNCVHSTERLFSLNSLRGKQTKEFQNVYKIGKNIPTDESSPSKGTWKASTPKPRCFAESSTV